MKLRNFIPVILVVVSACTVTPQGDGLKGDFNPPLVYRGWDTRTYVAQNGADVCALSSGYNGLTVLLSRHKGGPVNIDVKGNRTLVPGGMLDVNTDGGNFQTYEEYFSSASANKMVDVMSKGKKIYLEWSEQSGTYGGAPVRVQNVVKLDGFAGQLQKCRDALK